MAKKLTFEEVAPFFNALGNETRFMIIEMLSEKPRTVTEIYSTLNAKQSKISNDLRCLKECGFVHVKRTGNKRIYSVDEEVKEILISMKEHLRRFSKIINQCKTCCRGSNTQINTQKENYEKR